MSFFYPDYMLDSYRDLSPVFLKENGIRYLLLDMDNTLIPYEETLPTPEIVDWAEEIKKHGIRFALVTNNHKKRLMNFAAALPHPVPIYSDSAKPFPHNLKRAMKALNATKADTAMVGDQLFTDMLAARFAGIKSFVVPPIRDKRDPLTKCKRLLEKPLVMLYRKHHGEKSENEDG